MDGLIYLDNAATSWPKPPGVMRAMADFLEHRAGNPGRGGHALARRACETLEEARIRLAGVVGTAETHRLVLTHGCTDSVNIAIHGVLRASVCRCHPTKPHAVMTAIEHNAVLRTLHCAQGEGLIDVTVVPCDAQGRVDPQEVLDACRPETALVCVCHASNVLGTVQDVGAVGRELESRAPDALLLVDAAQTVGHLDVDVTRDRIDLLAVAGHKGLRGPTATGGLFVGPRAFPEGGEGARVICQRRGGTGAVAPGLDMPNQLPDAMEAGTSNGVGFAGLSAAIDELDPEHHRHEIALTKRIWDGLNAIDGAVTYGTEPTVERTPVVLFNVADLPARSVASTLDQESGIAVRGGVHCAPLLHQTIGTGELGGVRASPGPETTEAEADALIEQVARIASTVSA